MRLQVGATMFDTVTVENASDLQFGNPDNQTAVDFTISAWVKFPNWTPPQNDWVPFMGNGAPSYHSSAPGWVFSVGKAGTFRGWINGDVDYWGSSGGVIGDGNWHHVLMTMDMYADPKRLSGYVDGELRWERTFTPLGNTDSGMPTLIGMTSNEMETITTQIDDVAIWRRQLSEGERALVYVYGLAGKNVAQITPAPYMNVASSGLPTKVEISTAEESYEIIVTIRNSGIAPLNIENFGIEGSQADEYAFTPPEVSEVGVGETVAIPITWTPDLAVIGKHVADFSFEHDDPNKPSPHMVNLSVPVNEFIILFYEGFESAVLQEAVDEESEYLGWTHTAPHQWQVVNDMPDGEGVVEWRGWCFTTMPFWLDADGQSRDLFTGGTNIFAVADGDEYDDGNLSGDPRTDDLKTHLISPVIEMPAGSPAYISFDSDYYQEDYQFGRFDVSVNGGAYQTLKIYEQDFRNTHETFTIMPPDEENPWTLRMDFYYLGANDWWWAIDNVTIEGYDPTAGLTQARHWVLFD